MMLIMLSYRAAIRFSTTETSLPVCLPWKL